MSVKKCDDCDAKIIVEIQTNPHIRCYRINCLIKAVHLVTIRYPGCKMGIPVCCHCYFEMQEHCKAVSDFSRQIEVMGSHPLEPWDEHSDIAGSGGDIHNILVLLSLLQDRLNDLNDVLQPRSRGVIIGLALDAVKDNITFVEQDC